MATVAAPLTRKPLFIQAAAGDDPVVRLLTYDGYLMRCLVGGIWPRTGVVTNSAFAVSQRAAGVNWSVDVAGGFFVLGTTDGSEADRYLVHQQAVTNVPLTGFTLAPVAVRNHKVFLAVYDKEKMSAGDVYDAQIIITEDTGVGAPNPTAGSGLATWMHIATIAVGIGQTTIATANCTNVARHASMSNSHTTIPLAAGIVDASASMAIATPKVIRSSTTCKLQGGFRKTALTNFTASSTTVLGTIPVGYRPSSPRYALASGSTMSPTADLRAYAWRLDISTAGVMTAQIPALYTPDWLSVDGVTYEID